MPYASKYRSAVVAGILVVNVIGFVLSNLQMMFVGDITISNVWTASSFRTGKAVATLAPVPSL